MTSALPRVAGLLVAALLVVGSVGCSTGAPGAGGAPTTGLAVATAPPPDSADPDEDDPDDVPGAHGPVSANTASEDEIASALAAAGVGDPGRWAKEVVAHRPYPTDDRRLTKLREALAQDGPGAGTVDKIVAALRP